MSVFTCDPNVMRQPEPNQVADICWLARSILAQFMSEATDIEDANDDEYNPLIVEKDDDGFGRHYTTPVHTTKDLQAYLSNVPLISDGEEQYLSLSQSGYVALRIENQYEPVGIDNQDSDQLPELVMQDPGLGQIIFRLPQPTYEKAAIFKGYSVEPEKQIDASETAELGRIHYLLTCIGSSLRALVESDMVEYGILYHSNAPESLRSQRMSEEDFERLLGGE